MNKALLTSNTFLHRRCSALLMGVLLLITQIGFSACAGTETQSAISGGSRQDDLDSKVAASNSSYDEKSDTTDTNESFVTRSTNSQKVSSNKTVVSETVESQIKLPTTSTDLNRPDFDYRAYNAARAEGALVDHSGAAKKDILGVVHWGGTYADTHTTDYLNYGASKITELGVSVIKVTTLGPKEAYPLDTFSNSMSRGNAAATALSVCQSEQYRRLFANPKLKTYFLVVAQPDGVVNFCDGMSEREYAYMTQTTYELAVHLFKTYAGTGKTFVLQNWEGDNALGYAQVTYPSAAFSKAQKGICDYFNAMIDGVLKARYELEQTGKTMEQAKCFVYSCLEVNRILRDNTNGYPKLIDTVISQTYADLYSYSNWETHYFDASTVKSKTKQALDELAAKAPDSRYFGKKNIVMAEFGYPEKDQGESTQLLISSAEAEAAYEWGVQYMTYWEIFDNEDRGFWLIRPDGSKASIYSFFSNWLKS